MNDRLPRITPESLPPEQEALFRLLQNLSDALRQVHPRSRAAKPRNIEPGWLPPTDWTPEADKD